ncbi:glycosyltransferase [Kordiimonas marina]|uniref:glycosyltransferase n=1 Tax=Kordiimonas marina TaxID=2872312 RepID=UPI001FF650CC|nr:glycosyltransferase [Kordiimonas marina]MCJ9430765.1 glycosyltransferase [Kordiimonas marina]
MRTICFVTNEIYPEHKGGIGRMLYNIALRNAEEDAPDRLFLLLSWQPPKARAAIRAAFDGLAEVAFCPLSLGTRLSWALEYERSNPPVWHYGHAYRQSLMFYSSLLEVMETHDVRFDVIEFPDYGGWGLATMEAKAADLAFQETALAVRLHSTSGIIAEHQPFYHDPSPWNASVEEMERQCLLKADHVVGHVPGVIEANRTYYGFPAEWAARCVQEFPPIRLDTEEQAAAVDITPPQERDFIFSSRLQPFKQPDLFIKASARFLHENPGYGGRCRLISYGWDDGYIDELAALIPPHLKDRITLETGMSPEDRIAAVASGIVVIPSNYESLCLFAFEASHLGATLILNGACVAFGESSRWLEGRNCLTFDGTADSLVRRMVEALEIRITEKVSLEVTPSYWRQVAKDSGKPATRAADLTLVGHGFTDRDGVDRFLRVHGAMDADIVLMVPEGLDGGLEGLPSRVTPVIIGGVIPWPEDFARLAKACETAFIAFCRAETVIDAAYPRLALAAFARTPDLVAFGCHSRLTGRDGKDQGIRTHAGSAAGVALQARDILPDGAVFRTTTLRHMAETGRAFDGRAQRHWYSDLCRELAFDHAPMIIAPHPYVHEIAPAVRRPGNAAVDTTLIERLVRRTGNLGSIRALAMKPLPRVAKPDDPRLEVTPILRGAEQVRPVPENSDWSPVKYRMTEKDLLLHPVEQGWTVASLPITRADVPERLTLLIHHYGHDNPGVDIALFAGQGALDAATLDAMTAGRLPKGAMTAPWRKVNAGDIVEISLDLPAGKDFDWLIATAKPSEGSNTAYGWTYVTKVWLS